MAYSCTVCGFDSMPYPPMDYNICPCCGTEFGLDDAEKSHAQLREEWVQNGAQWFSDELQPSPLWDPFVQLVFADLEYDHSYESGSITNHIELPDSRVA